MKKLLKIPKFKNADEEMLFWGKVNLADYYEPSDFKRVVLPNLKPSTKVADLAVPR